MELPLVDCQMVTGPARGLPFRSPAPLRQDKDTECVVESVGDELPERDVDRPALGEEFTNPSIHTSNGGFDRRIHRPHPRERAGREQVIY